MRPVVIKVGGASVSGGGLEDLPAVVERGHPVVVVHGGGGRLSGMLEALGIPSEFRDGLRVTSEAAVEVAEMVFSGGVNKALAQSLQRIGVRAAGISGTDGPTLRVSPMDNLGRVGEVERVEPALVETLWDGGFVPVVAPLGSGPEGTYNVNADAAAGALAAGLGAEHLFLLTDVDGLQKDGELVESLSLAECEAYVEEGIAVGGMVPKLGAAMEAVRAGVEVRIVNGNKKSMLLESVEGKQAGTLITKEGAEAWNR